jgi:hypothetical protein
MRSLLLALAAGCSSATAAPDPCSAGALGISKATPLVAWTPPAGCTVVHAPARTIVHAQADLAALFRCVNGATPPQLDFTHNSLVVMTWDMSPAATGLDALDDGTTVTFVAKQRTPCPKDPHPMPMRQTAWFVIASANATRNFGDASCTIQSKC